MENLLNYAKSLNASEDVTWWLKNIADKNIKGSKITVSEIEHIIDWMVSSAAPKRLMKMSLETAVEQTNKWRDSNIKKGKNIVDSENDIETFLEFDDESKIVLLKTEAAFKREGFMMSHCLGGYSVRQGYKIYSLRDSENNPHATFEINIEGEEILQVKGKGNGEIHPKYIHKVLAFLEKLEIKIRSSEMTNLGYYLAPKIHLDLIKKCLSKKEKLVEINGDFYVT